MIGGGTHFVREFDNTGLREEFRDDCLYEKYWDVDPAYSNQIGHFLTAVHLGFDPSFLAPAAGPKASVARSWILLNVPDDEPLDITIGRLIAGHEMLADPAAQSSGIGRPYSGFEVTLKNIHPWAVAIEQYHAATPEHARLFYAALEAEQRGEEELAVELLEQILISPNPKDWSRGNSLQDLRLSMKGYHLGQLVGEEVLKDPQDIANWIRLNIAIPNVSTTRDDIGCRCASEGGE
jgi:hypothetical protein